MSFQGDVKLMSHEKKVGLTGDQACYVTLFEHLQLT